MDGKNMTTACSIPESFRDVTVLVTGGTGFMGKVLTEKLLRSCPDLKQIYLLIRDKKGKSMHQRLDELFQDPVSIALMLHHLNSNRQFNNFTGSSCTTVSVLIFRTRSFGLSDVIKS